MGRTAKPEKLKRLQGTERNDRRRTGAPVFPSLAAVPDPPHTLDEMGVQIWAFLCGELISAKILSSVDLISLELLVQAVQDYQEACVKLKGRPKVMFGVDKKPTVNPWVKIKRQNAELIQKMVGQFGLSPLARIKLTQLGSGDEPEDDPMRTFLFGAEDI